MRWGTFLTAVDGDGGQPRLSVVIPTLNESRHIDALLDDLQPLRADGHELILVDGGSDDDTVDRAGSRVDQLIVASRGRARQMNAGASGASNPMLWFLHADSRVPAGTHRQLAATATARCWGRFDVRLSGKDWRLRIVERLMNWRSCLSGIATGDQGIFVSRELFEGLGGFPEQPLMEDIALCKRLRRLARPQCIHTPRLQTSSRRWESGGVGRTILLMWGLRLAYALGAPPERLARHYR